MELIIGQTLQTGDLGRFYSLTPFSVTWQVIEALFSHRHGGTGSDTQSEAGAKVER